MRIVEYQSKKLCETIGIPIPKSKLILNTRSPRDTLSDLQFPIVLKAQVTAKNRGKYGGISLAKDFSEANTLITRMFMSPVKGMRVPSVLAEELIEFEDAYSINLAFDETCCEVILSGTKSISSNNHNGDHAEGASEVFKFAVNPLLGITQFQIEDMAISLGIENQNLEKFSDILQKLWQVFSIYDATYMDLSPLVVDDFQDFYLLGIQMEIDGSALFRQDEICEIIQFEESDRPTRFWQLGCEYQYLDGRICVVGNDLEHCLLLQDFLAGEMCSVGELIGMGDDVSGEKVGAIFDLILRQPETKAIFFNMNSDLGEGDPIIESAYRFYSSHENLPPLVVRMLGEKTKISARDLERANIHFVNNFEEAIGIFRRKDEKDS